MLSKALLILCAASQAVSAPTMDKRVTMPLAITVDKGTVIGSSLLGIDSWKGIPFAQPPVGNLRLRAPLAITQSYGTITTTGIPPSCPQQLGSVNTSAIPIGSSTLNYLMDLPLLQQAQGFSENCLTLNVQRPSGTTKDSKLPVVVWIYGGGFEFGSTQMYDGSSIISKSVSLGKPVLYASMNYRVGGWGFLAGSDLAGEGNTNLGLRDQRLALQWVQDNIAAFGGDPTKVTIWGESAGSISVCDHTIINGGDNTYKGKPLFRGAIMDSGSLTPADTVTSISAQNVYNQVVNVAGCGSAANKLTCLRALDYATFAAAVNSQPGILSYRSIDLSYLPRPDPGNSFFSQSPEAAVMQGKFTKVPIIVGDEEDEGTLFSLFQSNITTNAQLIDYLTTFFPQVPNAKTLVTALVATYPDDNGQSGSPFRTGLANNIYPQFKRLAAILGDVSFTLIRRYYLSQVATQVNAWSYLGSYFYGTPILGTFHATDLLTTYELTGPSIPQDTIQSYYISFINSLDPNALGTPLPLIQWPKWTPSTVQLMNFQALSNVIILDNFRSSSYNFIASNPTTLRI